MVKDGQYILSILELARLSPSSHNTQPWKVSVNKNKVIVGYEPQRQLTVGDPDMRELFISLGCFIQTAAYAAQSLGYKMTTLFMGEGPEGVAELLFTKASKPEPELEDAITHRRSDRRKFLDKPIPKDEMDQLKKLTSGTAKLAIFTSEEDVKFLSEMTKKATLTAMKRDEFREELAGWVRHNWTKLPDGMPAYVQGIPGPVSLLAKTIIKKNPKVADSQAKKDAKSVFGSSAVALITLADQSPRTWLDAGRLYQKLCIEAQLHDIHTAAFSAAVVDGNTVSAMMDRLEMSDHPVALLRLGYAKNLPRPTPRRSLNAILATAT
jgi:nitroreductase